MMNIFHDIYIVERNGRTFYAHWKNRYDPATALLAAGGAGLGLQTMGILQQGRETQQIANQRSAVDIANAKAVERAAAEEATVRREQTRKLIASQKSAAATGGIRLNVGVPLLVEAETRNMAAREITFLMNRAGAEAGSLRHSAALEKYGGKLANKQAKLSAITTAVSGITSLAFMGYEAGMFTKPPTIKTSPAPGFGVTPTHLGTFYA